MRVVCTLAWFDEDPALLVATVDSMGRAGVDHLIAADGAYRLYPGAKPSSPREQHQAIHDTAKKHGMGVTVHVPQRSWQNNEVEKRNFLMAAAHLIAVPGEDWIFPLDADETIAEANGYRAELAETRRAVCSVLYHEQGCQEVTHRRLFRAHPKGIRVERAHYYNVDGDGNVLWGPAQVPRQLLHMVVLHEPLKRERERDGRQDQYCEARMLDHAEVEM